ncbi:MAG: hypothetical protein ACI8P9_000275 [Parasphingorhabdus sp.]|jgi:hypothetical protein
MTPTFRVVMSALITRIFVQPLLVAIALLLLSGTLVRAQNTDDRVMEKIVRYLDSAIYIVPGQGVGPLSIGMSFADVGKVLGEPFASEKTGFFNRHYVFIFKSGTNTWIKIEGKKFAEEISVQGDASIQTPKGARVGMPRHQVKLIYGKDFEQKEKQTIRYSAQGIEFTFQSGLLYQINVFQKVAVTN